MSTYVDVKGVNNGIIGSAGIKEGGVIKLKIGVRRVFLLFISKVACHQSVLESLGFYFRLLSFLSLLLTNL